jgi:hypothetical protein
MAPMTARELRGGTLELSLADRLFDQSDEELLERDAPGLAINDYLDVALASGFPEALSAATPALAHAALTSAQASLQSETHCE